MMDEHIRMNLEALEFRAWLKLRNGGQEPDWDWVRRHYGPLTAAYGKRPPIFYLPAAEPVLSGDRYDELNS